MTWKKIASIVGGVVLIISLITGIWAFDDRYAHSNDIKEVGNDIKEVEQKTLKSFEDLKVQQKQEIIKQSQEIEATRIEIIRAKQEIYKDLKSSIDKDYETYKKLRDENPDDASIREMYDEILKDKILIDRKIIELNKELDKLEGN